MMKLYKSLSLKNENKNVHKAFITEQACSTVVQGELCAQIDKLLSPMPKTDKVDQKNDPH